MSLTFAQKKKLKEMIDKLPKESHLEIYFFLHKNKIKFTKNNNGYFFIMNQLSDDLILKLKEQVNYYYKFAEQLKLDIQKRIEMTSGFINTDKSD